MSKQYTPQEQLLAENEHLRTRLDEAEETLRAIHSGEVDALIVRGAAGEQIFTLKGSDHSYRVLIEDMMEGALTLTADGVILYANRCFAEMLKTPLEKVIGSALHTWITPDEQNVFQALIRSDATQTYWHGEAFLFASDGTLVPVNLSISVLRSEDTPGLLCVVATDLTEQKRTEAIAASEKLAKSKLEAANQSNIQLQNLIEESKRAQEALRKSEESFHRIFDESPLGIAIAGPDFRFMTANSQFCGMMGYEKKELIMISFKDITHPDHLAADKENVEKLALGAIPIYRTEKRYIRKNGEVVWGSSTITAVCNQQGKLVYFLAMVEDITERKRVEEALRKSEEKYRIIAENTADIITMLDMNLKTTYVSPSVERITGFTVDEYLEQPFDQTMTPASKDEAIRLFTEEMELEATGTAAPDRSRIVLTEEYHKDGSTLWLEGKFSFLRDSDLRPVGIIGISRDITDRKRAEEALAMLKKAVEMSSDVIFMTDSEGIITFINHEFTRLYGYAPEEVIGKVTPRILKSEKMAPHDYEMFWNTLLSKQVFKRELINKVKDGRLINIDSSVNSISNEQGAIVGFLAVQRDITAHKQLEAQLQQSQKMESVGRLAGGVAHDFNNLLTVISGHTDLAMMQFRPQDPVYSDLQEIQAASDRAAGLTRQLLAFSRKQVLDPKIINVSSLVENLSKMLRRMIGEDVRLTIKDSPEVGNIKADPGQIEQVIINLSTNARDAMPDGGNLTIESQNVTLDADYCRNYPGLDVGQYVQISVSDDGCGMTQDVITKIFEPFFTTKETGKGTGLGLSTVFGIVKQSGGHIHVYSEIGSGTTFKIYFPRVFDAVSQAEALIGLGNDKLQGTETILVVEDEGAVRQFAQNILQKHGYKVITANSGGDALLICEKMEKSVDLVLTDVIMPGITGVEFVARLRKKWPDVKALFMSGYTADAISRLGVLEPGTHFIGKPFRLTDLLKKVREVIENLNTPPVK